MRALIRPQTCHESERNWSHKMRRTNELTLLPKLPLLVTECAEEIDDVRHAFEQENTRCGIIGHMYVHAICAIVWEILRLRRCKVAIINSAFRSALEDLLQRLREEPGQYSHDRRLRIQSQVLAHLWF